MNPKLLLCATLALPSLALAAPKAPAPQMPPAPPMEGHSPDDGHDHGGASTANQGTLTDYLWRKSDDAFHAGDFPRAVELHRAIVTLDPTDSESFGVGAWLLWSLGKRAEADAFIAQGLKANPKDPEMWNVAAQQYDLEKDFTASQKAYGQAVELSGDKADQMLRRRYAHASEHAGDLNASLQTWRALVKDFPGEAVNKSNLARVEAQIAAGAQKVSFDRNSPAAILTLVGAALVLGVPFAGRLGKSA